MLIKSPHIHIQTHTRELNAVNVIKKENLVLKMAKTKQI